MKTVITMNASRQPMLTLRDMQEICRNKTGIGKWHAMAPHIGRMLEQSPKYEKIFGNESESALGNDMKREMAEDAIGMSTKIVEDYEKAKKGEMILSAMCSFKVLQKIGFSMLSSIKTLISAWIAPLTLGLAAGFAAMSAPITITGVAIVAAAMALWNVAKTWKNVSLTILANGIETAIEAFLEARYDVPKVATARRIMTGFKEERN